MPGQARLTIFPEKTARQVRRQSLNGRLEIAEQIAADARATAPVLTGAFRRGIGVEVSGTQVMVVDNDPDAIHKEYGTSRTPAHATLTSAASRHGRYSGMKPR